MKYPIKMPSDIVFLLDYMFDTYWLQFINMLIVNTITISLNNQPISWWRSIFIQLPASTCVKICGIDAWQVPCSISPGVFLQFGSDTVDITWIPVFLAYFSTPTWCRIMLSNKNGFVMYSQQSSVTDLAFTLCSWLVPARKGWEGIPRNLKVQDIQKIAIERFWYERVLQFASMFTLVSTLPETNSSPLKNGCFQ